jgi:GNAT acetyltransferase
MTSADERVKSEALRRLAIAAETKFVLSASGRILRENDPNLSPGPRLFVAGCPTGNLTYVRHDVPDRTAAQVLDLMAAEPPWLRPAACPQRFGQVMQLLLREQPISSIESLLIYTLPRHGSVQTDLRFVCSNTDSGAALLDHFARVGLPHHLIDAGFTKVCDFWAPWCVALDGGAIAAMAFAARLGERGAEVGVYTFPGWRSRGLAAAVTAKWSSLPELTGRELFYSVSATNTSSQRVTTRLGLQQLAVELRVV